MNIQKELQKEVDEYNEIIKKIQTINQTAAELEQKRLLKLGRVQFLQEMKEESDKSASETKASSKAAKK